MPQTLAFDLGGSSLRVAIVAADGHFVALVRRPLSISSRDGVSFDVHPMEWWDAFVDSCAELAGAGHDLAGVSAIAGCGFTRTQVFLDERGNPVRAAIAFQDSRAARLLGELRSDPREPVRSMAGRLGPYDPLARLLWVKANEPENWARLHKVIEPKDFLNLMLTGVAVSDSISQVSTTRTIGHGGNDVLEAMGIDRGILPDVISPFARAGTVREGLPGPLSGLAGLPVYCGSIDTWSCVLGSGGLTPGLAYSISGTSDVSGVISETPHTATGLLTVQWGEGIWQLGGPSLGAATRLQWALERFCPDDPSLECVEAAIARPGEPPLFLPYLDGERTPWWDPELRGAFFGLSASHEGPDFVRAVAEGINYLSREILSRAEEATGTPVAHVCFSGGLARNPAICQLKADVLNRPVFVPHNPETGLMGAARIPEADGSFVLPVRQIEGTVYEPSRERRRYHDDRFEIFRRASSMNAELSKQLALADRRGASSPT